MKMDWKQIIDYPEYEVRQCGQVRKIANGKILKMGVVGKGYLQVCFLINSKVKKDYLHRILAKAFIPNPENKSQVNHINGKKADNRLESLEWVTPGENIRHAYSSGLVSPIIKVKQGAKLSFDQVREIRSLSTQDGKILAHRFGVTYMTIRNVLRGKTYSIIK